MSQTHTSVRLSTFSVVLAFVLLSFCGCGKNTADTSAAKSDSVEVNKANETPEALLRTWLTATKKSDRALFDSCVPTINEYKPILKHYLSSSMADAKMMQNAQAQFSDPNFDIDKYVAERAMELSEHWPDTYEFNSAVALNDRIELFEDLEFDSYELGEPIPSEFDDFGDRSFVDVVVVLRSRFRKETAYKLHLGPINKDFNDVWRLVYGCVQKAYVLTDGHWDEFEIRE